MRRTRESQSVSRTPGSAAIDCVGRSCRKRFASAVQLRGPDDSGLGGSLAARPVSPIAVDGREDCCFFVHDGHDGGGSCTGSEAVSPVTGTSAAGGWSTSAPVHAVETSPTASDDDGNNDRRCCGGTGPWDRSSAHRSSARRGAGRSDRKNATGRPQADVGHIGDPARLRRLRAVCSRCPPGRGIIWPCESLGCPSSPCWLWSS